MNTLQNRTVLITGGSSGIGLELTKALLNKGNRVLICGRSLDRLEQVKKRFPKVGIFPCDISKPEERLDLRQWVINHFKTCDILVNNAAIVHKTDFATDDNITLKAENEINTNLLAPIALSKLFLPLLQESKNAAIVNITTGLVYAPRAVYPIYNATKSGLHAFTQVLRYQLRKTRIKVIEVMMPVVDTPWHKGEAPSIAISPERAVSEMVDRMEKGEQEIRVGRAKILYALSRIAPAFAFKKINSL